MRVLGIIQARSGSTRLPGKVLAPILGVPMLGRQIERVLRAGTLDRLIVATSVDPSDDPVAEVAETAGVACARGSLDDVLDRFYRAALPWAPEHVVRLTGDCPLGDPAVIDGTVRLHLEGEFDYSSSAIEPTFPDGLDVEVVRFSVLKQAWREADRRADREHVTLWVYSRAGRFRIGSYQCDRDLSRMRWTVDEPQDLSFVVAVYERLYPENPAFGMRDVLELLEREPELADLNCCFARNEGLDRSLAQDPPLTDG